MQSTGEATKPSRLCRALVVVLGTISPQMARAVSREAPVVTDDPSTRLTQPTHDGSKRTGVAWTLMVAAAVACLAAFQFGFATGMLNVPQEAITRELGVALNGWIWSAVVSSWCFAGLLGAQTAASIADKRGRRASLALTAVICALSGVVMFAAGSVSMAAAHDELEVNQLGLGLLVAGRVISGVGCGMATVATPLYLGEIASTSVRGLFGSLNQLAVVLSIFFAQAMAAAAQLENLHYRWVLGAPAILGAAQLLMLPLMPESPRWCLSAGGGVEAAQAALRRLRVSGDSSALDEELEQMRSDLRKMMRRTAAAGNRRRGVLALWKKQPDMRLPLVAASVMMMGQQCSGINAVFYYSTSFFASAGLSNPLIGTLLASGVNALAMVATVPMMERAGRRRLLLVGIGGMLFAALALSMVLLAEESPHLDVSRHTLDTAAIGFVLLFVATFELGPGPIPWQIGAEIFPEGPRATAMGFAATLNWLCNASVGLGFPLMQGALGPYVFFPFAAVLALWLGFTFRFVPETRGRSVSEIQAEFLRLAGIHRRSTTIISEAADMLHGVPGASSAQPPDVEQGGTSPNSD